jgi:hypothetical protein
MSEEQWLDGATIALTWSVRALAAIIGFLVIRFIYRMITYKDPEIDKSGRSRVFSDALATLGSGQVYRLTDISIFDGREEKIRLFAEALSGQLKHHVGFDDLSWETSGEVLFFTGAEEQIEEDQE